MYFDFIKMNYFAAIIETTIFNLLFNYMVSFKTNLQNLVKIFIYFAYFEFFEEYDSFLKHSDKLIPFFHNNHHTRLNKNYNQFILRFLIK